MERLFDSLLRAQGELSRAGIDSAAVGGLAVAAWGRARATQDVDLKVLLDRSQAQTLLDLLASSYTFLVDQPLATLQSVGFVFTKDEDNTRVDFLLADLGFDREAIDRAVAVEVQPGKRARICSAEDLIVYKLISTRARDHEDASSVVARQRGQLDLGYVERWLREFEQALDDSTLVSTFREMLRRAGP